MELFNYVLIRLYVQYIRTFECCFVNVILVVLVLCPTA
jgi:hypothetical protein